MQGIVAPGLAAEPSNLFASTVDPDKPLSFDNEVGRPSRGTFFDEFIEIQEPERAAFVEQVLAHFEVVRPRQRIRNEAARASHNERISRLVANAMRAHFYRVSRSVLYFRKADAEWYQSSPSWMRHGALGEAVDALMDSGLFRGTTGRKMPWYSSTPSSASSFAATDALIAMALECGVEARSIKRHIPREELVRLFSPKAQVEFDWIKGSLVQPRKGERIKFDQTNDSAAWTTTLAAINEFYRQQDISLGLTPEQMNLWLTDRNSDPSRTGAAYRIPESFKTDIYRVFNNGEQENPRFDHGGRLFGGWWMPIPADLREAITINGQPTIELDYSNCHPRMLYAERGLDCDGDLYELAEITAIEERTGTSYRPFIKWMMQVLLNGKRRPNEDEKPAHLACPPDLTVKEVAALLEARHQPIADAFKTGAGLRLMRLESDIALEIIATAKAEGWVALSVHDSFITTIDRHDRLKELMIQTYFQRMGRNPVIK